jgi:hypothetical protein
VTSGSGATLTTLTETGTITPGNVSSNTFPGVCSSTPCTAAAAVHGPIIDVTYTVVVGGVTVVCLVIHTDLGGVTTSTTYQSSPNAS